ncbi:MAG: aldo/keto reductase [Fibrobacter sp.]|nr:aldo/keto reductase [Fibrobacter sp.]
MPLGLGCWAFGGMDWGTQNDSDSIAAIKTAFHHGITHFDTAQVYGKGHSEEILGKALKPYRDKVFIASKTALRPREKVLPSIELSLRRLKTDYIDLFYIHWPRVNGDLEGMMEGLEVARDKGLIRLVGVSNFSIEQLQRVSRVGKVDVHQICYNLLWRWPEEQMISYCQSQGIAIITYSSLAQGILTGKFQDNVQFAEGDHRKNIVFFEDLIWPKIFDGVNRLKTIAAQTEFTLTELAIRWVASRSGVKTVLVGVRDSNQVKQNINSFSKKIPPDILEKLTQVSDLLIKEIPDTGNIFRYYP